MDEIILRFPMVAKRIFEELDNQCLTKSKCVNQIWNLFINESKSTWIRILNKYNVKSFESKFRNHWKLLVKRESVHNLRKITTAVYRFYLKNTSRQEFHWSPHHIAADYGNVRLYIDITKKFGFENRANDNDVTPLHIAVQCGHIEICKIIIENTNGNKNPRKKNGWTPLHIAAKKGHFEILKLIIGQVEDKNPAISTSNSQGNNFYGGTPLHFAVSENHLKICKLILGEVKNKNPPDIVGRTPLHNAASSGNYYICKLILENLDRAQFSRKFEDGINYDKNPKDAGGKTPLHLAAREGHLKICKLILNKVDFDSDKNPRDNLGRTPFQMATSKKIAVLLYREGGTDGDGGIGSLFDRFEIDRNELPLVNHFNL